MLNDSRLHRRVRWQWILPTLALEVTLLLWFTGMYEKRPSGMGYTSTSWGIETILNYPAERVGIMLRFVDRITYALPGTVATTVANVIQLVYVVLFWTWIGWIIDTKNDRSAIPRHVVWAGCLYAILFAFCIFVVWVSWRGLASLPSWLHHESGSPFTIQQFDNAVGAIWCVVGAVYFGKKALSAWKSRSIHTQLA